MDKGEALRKVTQYKDLLSKHMNFDSMYLYGSFAKGTNRDDSDIDVAIIVNRIHGDFFTINPMLWKLRRQIDDRIEPILIEKDFDELNFLNEIKKNGIEIA
ncbi:MAG: nucleotidyltransferase domain-containing protein [Prolixibacteraceae bacterium]|jgi:predicted nucleotidyltransferase|nr:nucleotidyltransferase domain-containing protein [Prolixibacteraceae bacterium]